LSLQELELLTFLALQVELLPLRDCLLLLLRVILELIVDDVDRLLKPNLIYLLALVKLLPQG
jgi:hypothetical protein